MYGFLLTRPLRDVTGWLYSRKRRMEFLLTRPLRDVTPPRFKACPFSSISTHTPLAGRDPFRFFTYDIESKFLLTRPLRDVTVRTALCN